MSNFSLIIQHPQNANFLHERLLSNCYQSNNNGNSQPQKLPKFQDVWNSHNGKDPTYIDATTGNAPVGFEHQCAINMAYALQKSGVDMTSFTGKTISVTIEGKK